MSGPITRQYGVPNWDDIFGKKDPEETNSKVTRNEDTPPPAESTNEKKTQESESSSN